MDGWNSWPIWQQVVVGLFLFFVILSTAGALFSWYTRWRDETTLARWRGDDQLAKKKAFTEFWMSEPSPEAEAVFWRHRGAKCSSDIRAFLEGKDARELKSIFESHGYRFLFPAVQAARAAGVPIAHREEWIDVKVQEMKDEFNADPANSTAPWA